MGLPLAVAPSVRTPGLSLLVDLLAGQSSPGSNAKRALLMSPKGTAGTITNDTQLEKAVAGEAAVGVLLGPGSPGHLAAKAIFKELGNALVDVIAPAPSGGAAATGKFTFDAGPPTKDWEVTAEVAGRTFTIFWRVGESNQIGSQKLRDAINGKGSDVPVTAASAAGAGVAFDCNLTFKQTGTWGNDCKIAVKQIDGTTGTVVASGAALTTGAGESDPAAALAVVAGTEYDLIILCTSNTDAKLASSTSGPGRVKTHIDGLDSGRSAKLQQAVIGTTLTLTGTKTGTGQHNFGPMQYIHCEAGQSLPCEFAGAELGARLREESLDAACNRIEMPYQAILYGAKDLNADALTDVEVEDALQTGVTPITYTADGALRPARPITTYHKDAGAAPDDRLLDTSRVTGTYAVAKDLRIAIPREFPNAKLSKDLLPGEEELPEGIIEERDVKSFIDGRIRFWIARGVVIRDKYLAALANGSFVVRVNPTDKSQCDIVLPIGIVPPLAKFSLVVQHVGPN